MVRDKSIRWALVLGFALGGFFDGILLHQILQWHHLLSLVPGAGDLTRQVLWDGLFHAFMYLLAAAGLWGLWRAHRRHLMPTGAGLAGALALGFGLWHVTDAVLSHWILGLHRVRIEAEAPLAWDLGWLTVFGLVPMGTGWVFLRRGQNNPPGRGGAALAALVILCLGSGAWAARPSNAPYTLAVFAPNRPPEHIARDLANLGANVVWSGPTLQVALLDVPAQERWALYRHGAVFVSGTALPAGCLGWSAAS
ncbi:DUF2243 domain-containing protein [Rubellimicrobium rubrum]|uniref:DUF2243 domain-containing protein n=1 Tax=Rubellimicrobium rubrum TaxID=2585369 RepID=A0A5C4MZM1_9RHOB|nr:DUF2243 domain-containing protein [Rubellimicrobium rubrum]TNC51218.1 DUF2243 domain-containing protein [Rubellimicrobium rubrum]